MRLNVEKNWLNYVKTITHTNTELEKNNEIFFKNWVENVPYLKNNSDNWGLYPIKNDYLDRKIAWALLKGKGDKTVVLMHHSDTVDTDDYGIYKDIAYTPYELEKLFKEGKFDINKETKLDLDSAEWAFGRGASDMKSGGAIQLSLFEEYSKGEFDGNVVVMCLPDEENFSAGMRSAIYLLKDLKEKYDLEYVLMVNSEPHERVDEKKITIYDGTVGKIMPLFLAKGKLAHVGQIFLGINPTNILSQIQRDTELNLEFMESKGNTVSPPGTWLYLKDRKQVYDVSLPLTAGGYMSILNLKKSPREIMQRLKEISIESARKVSEDMQLKYQKFREVSPIDYGNLKYDIKVVLFEELLREVTDENPQAKEVYDKYKKELVNKIKAGEIDTAEACFLLIEKVLEYRKDSGAVVVLAMAPPFYPSASNSQINKGVYADELIENLKKYSKEKFNTEIEVQNYYTGICDLSYAMYNFDDIDYVENNILLWKDYYEIPLREIKELSMPILNIGAWGKDLHKYTERVYKKDLFEVIPELLDYTIKYAIKNI